MHVVHEKQTLRRRQLAISSRQALWERAACPLHAEVAVRPGMRLEVDTHALAVRLFLDLGNVALAAEDDSTPHCFIIWADGLNCELALLQTKEGLRNIDALTSSLIRRAIQAGCKPQRNLVSIPPLVQQEAPAVRVRLGLICRLPSS